MCLFKVNNGNTKTKCEIWSKLTKKTPERCHCCRTGAFIASFEQISYHTLYIGVCIVDFEQINVGRASAI